VILTKYFVLLNIHIVYYILKPSHTSPQDQPRPGVFDDHVIVVWWSLEISGDLCQSLIIEKTGWWKVFGNHGLSDQRLSLVVIGTSVTGLLIDNIYRIIFNEKFDVAIKMNLSTNQTPTTPPPKKKKINFFFFLTFKTNKYNSNWPNYYYTNVLFIVFKFWELLVFLFFSNCAFFCGVFKQVHSLEVKVTFSTASLTFTQENKKWIK
jgi:hypothetical protein